MSSLMIALASLGGLVLTGVVVHGTWQARRADPKRATPTERIEPRGELDDAQNGVPNEMENDALSDVLAPDVPDTSAAPAASVPETFNTPESLVAASTAGQASPPRPTVTGTTTLPKNNASTTSAAPAPKQVAAQPQITLLDVPVVMSAQRLAAKRASHRIDALIDSITQLTLTKPVTGALALQHFPPSRRAGSKPFMIEGKNSESHAWEAPVSGQQYSEFQAGVQLANRTGALNEIEYSEFVQKVQTFADAVSALVHFPDMLEVVEAARALDHFASQYDAQLAVHLKARAAAWSVGYIQQQAGRSGFALGVLPGRLVLPAAAGQVAGSAAGLVVAGPPVLTLVFDSQAALADDPNMAAVREVMLSFDVPQTAPSAEPFKAWQASAEALALSMEAHLVDDQGQPLGAEGFTSIGHALGQLYSALEARALPAGSAVARRLFS
jgi:hypothetical protein